MEKRWFASLWLVVVAGASLAIQAEEEPLDLKFPLLPVRHLQWEKELPKPIGVGDRIPAVLMLSENSDPPGAEVEVATPSGHTTLLKEGVSLAETDTSVPGTIRFIVVPLRPGPITVPEMGLRKKGEKTFFARTEPLSLGAVDPLKDQEKPKEYFEAVSLGFPRWLLVVVVLVGLLLLSAIIFGVVILVRRLMAKEAPVAPAAPPRPEDELALEALRRLKARDLPIKGAFKEFHFGISDTLKEYLGARYRFDALESTTSELIQALEAHHVGDNVVDQIESLYTRLDVVKFTDYKPAVADCELAFEDARRLIQQTRRPPAPAPAVLGAAAPIRGGGST